MASDKKQFAYYRELATKTAHDLSKIVREKNGVPLNPRNGTDLALVPVYETDNFAASLLSITNDMLDTKILTVSAAPGDVDAYWKRYKDKNIIVLTEQNYCLSRFYACKELMHSYLYDTGEKIEIELPVLNQLILEMASGLPTNTESSVHCLLDVSAYYGAIEFLLPSDVMPLLIATITQLEATEGREKAIEQMAIWMRVPLSLLEFKIGQNEDAIK